MTTIRKCYFCSTEQGVNLTDISNVDFSRLSLLSNEVGGGDQMDAVTEGALLANLGQQLHAAFGHFDTIDFYG